MSSKTNSPGNMPGELKRATILGPRYARFTIEDEVLSEMIAKAKELKNQIPQFIQDFEEGGGFAEMVDDTTAYYRFGNTHLWLLFVDGDVEDVMYKIKMSNPDAQHEIQTICNRLIAANFKDEIDSIIEKIEEGQEDNLNLNMILGLQELGLEGRKTFDNIARALNNSKIGRVE